MERRRYQVFVSSTLKDLLEERRALWESLISFDYIVAGMENFPASNDSQFEFIKKQILQSDFYVLVQAGRYGSIGSAELSFTEMEYDFAVASKIPVYVFQVKDLSALPVSKSETDEKAQSNLKAFREKTSANRLCDFWQGKDELCLGVLKALQQGVLEGGRPGWIRGDALTDQATLRELHDLYKENQTLKDKLRADESKSDNFGPNELAFPIQIDVHKTGSRAKPRRVSATVGDIIGEIGITEVPTDEIIKQSLRGIGSVSTGWSYADTEVDRDSVDRAISTLSALKIVSLQSQFDSIKVTPGKKWLVAHALAKVSAQK